MNYETVIGIEIHCELKTKSKMFSGSPVSYGQAPNTCTNEIDLGHPGTLPSLNKNAVKQALKACIALNLEIDTLIRFDRKNYYYSDLPKGFQISQQFYPIGKAGYVDIETEQGQKRIRINRLHMEEDTAKQYHVEDKTWIDFNRAGIPLVEIVSEPDIRSATEAQRYVEKLRTLLVYLEVTDGKMEEGSLRCDINISLRPIGTSTYGTKTEIKNLNSIANIEKAVKAEIIRQSALLDSGQAVQQATRRYDDKLETTVLMRQKEGTVDYKYFPEPNIPPIRLTSEWIEEIRQTLPELPDVRYQRYLSMGLNTYDTQQLILNKALSDFFDRVAKQTTYTKILANWCLSELLAIVDQKQLENHLINSEQFALFINHIGQQTISSKQAKEILPFIIKGENYDAIVSRMNILQVSDNDTLVALILEVLNENAQSILDYHAGKDKALGFLMGQVMKKSKGQANPVLCNQILLEELSKRKA
ncbi:MAG: Asp-tRNA(Asn)/Glu-tRNA(Gln) amidotransferase subunit GatB [Erysipelotrichaceae bacterium]